MDTRRFGLDEVERELLQRGLWEWSGPAKPTEELALAMGFDSVAALHAEADRLSILLEADAPMALDDWMRALLATEIVFVSNTVGSGRDWVHTTGWSDAETLEMLRTIQSKLTRHLRPIIGRGFGTRLPRNGPPPTPQGQGNAPDTE
ncbi:MAG: hypothetical protein AAGA48_34795 [Myxococcota bacterium]